MSSVEMRVVLLGDDPEQQQAFKSPQSTQRHEQSGNIAPPVASRRDSASEPDRASGSSVIQSVDELIAKLDELIRVELGRERGSRERRPSAPSSGKDTDEQSGMLDTVMERLSKAAEKADRLFSETHLGRTLAGQRFLHYSRMAGRGIKSVASRVSKARKRFAPAASEYAKGLGKSWGSKAFSKTEGGLVKATAKGANSTAHHAVRTGLGAAGSAAATGEGAGALAAVGGAAAVAAPLVIVGIAAAGAAYSIHKMIESIHEATEALTDLSPEVAAVSAELQVQHELARLDRASRIGAGAANLEAARGRIQESMYELQTRMLELMLRASPVLEGTLDAVNLGVRQVDNLLALFNLIWSKVNDLPIMGPPDFNDNKKAEDDFKESTKALAEAIREMFTQNQPDFHGIDPFLRDVFNAPVGGAPPQPPKGRNLH